MLTNHKFSLKAGFIVLALSLGACSSSSSTPNAGTGGKGGNAGSTAGSGGGTAGTGGGGTTGTAGSDGGTAGGDGGTLTPAQINDMIINAPSTSGTTINRAAPKTYNNGTCM